MSLSQKSPEAMVEALGIGSKIASDLAAVDPSFGVPAVCFFCHAKASNGKLPHMIDCIWLRSQQFIRLIMD